MRAVRQGSTEERRRLDPRAPGGARASTASVTSVDLEPFAGAAESLDRRRRDPRLGRARSRSSSAPYELLGRAATWSSRAAPSRRSSSRSRTPRAGSPRRSRAARGPSPSPAASERTSSPTGSREHRALSARRGRRGRARALDRGASCRRCASSSSRRRSPTLSRHARLREAKTHVVGPMCHVLWRWTTGDAVGPNMMTRNAYALNMALRDAAGAGADRAGDPRGEHGRRQEAVVRVLPVRPRQDGARRDAR